MYNINVELHHKWLIKGERLGDKGQETFGSWFMVRGSRLENIFPLPSYISPQPSDFSPQVIRGRIISVHG